MNTGLGAYVTLRVSNVRWGRQQGSIGILPVGRVTAREYRLKAYGTAAVGTAARRIPEADHKPMTAQPT